MSADDDPSYGIGCALIFAAGLGLMLWAFIYILVWRLLAS